MRHQKLFLYTVLISGFAFALALMLLPTQSVFADASAPTISSEDCTLTVMFTASVAGDYTVTVFDDGDIVFNETQTADADTELTFTYVFTTIGDAAPGVGIFVLEDGSQVFGLDPYTTIDDTCDPVTGDPCPGPPASSVGATLVQTTELFWAPSMTAETGVLLEAGKDVRAMGPDSSGDWFYVHYACQNLWVPASVLGPDFSAPWDGEPLPTNVQS